MRGVRVHCAQRNDLGTKLEGESAQLAAVRGQLTASEDAAAALNAAHSELQRTYERWVACTLCGDASTSSCVSCARCQRCMA